MGGEALNFEIVDAIKFFGALVSTPEVSPVVKEKANNYLLNLVDSLEKNVNSLITGNSNIKVIRGK